MANLFFNLPAPAANGAGAAVDVSTMGKLKSLAVSGQWGPTITPIITIEINNDLAQAGSWTAIWSTQGGGTITVSVACKWMRARVQNYRGGQAPEIDVGSDDGGTTLAALDVPASGNGVGSSVDVSALPNYKTIQCCGSFQGAVIIEISEDGTTSWAQVAAFQSGSPASVSLQLAAHYMRARRAGVPVINPGTPVVNVAACPDGGGSGGGGSNLWAAGVGAGSVLQNNATGNTAGGLDAISAVSEATASGDHSIAMGLGPTASAANAVALGHTAHATAAAATAIGENCTASGANSLAMGSGSTASGGFSTAIGNGVIAAGASATAIGDRSNAIRESQFSHASGRIAANGDAQASWLELRGTTPGAAPGEAVELKFGELADQTFQCEDGKAYLITIEAVAKDTVAGGKGVQCYMQRYALRRAAGVTTLAASGAADQFGDPASATWTLVATIGAAPDRLVLTFTTTGAQAAARCLASMKFVEVNNP